MIDIMKEDLLVMWTVSLMFVMWRTHSFKSNTMLSIIVSSLFVISVLNRLFGTGCIYLTMAVLTVMVWMEVPKITKYNRRFNDA